MMPVSLVVAVLMALTSDLRLCSFNCRGFKSSAGYITELFKEMDFLALQELWLGFHEVNLLLSIDVDVVFSFTTPMQSDVISVGRPFGGVALLWHRRFHEVCPVKSVCDRLVAVTVNTTQGVLLVIAVYMPVDGRRSGDVIDYDEVLGAVGGVMDSVKFDDVVIMGDWNADLRSDSRFSRLLRGFLLTNHWHALGLRTTPGTVPIST
eukprot:m.102323 g.102323  ORF g.102323 m.102323 type:complete len:207 (+) comp37165_c0_seq2:596-1216(+)